MKLSIVPFIFFSTLLFQNWVLQPIDDRISVSFPSTPTKQFLQGQPYYTLVSEGFNCTVMATDYKDNAPDSVTLAAYMASPAAVKSSEEGLTRDFVGAKIQTSKTTVYAHHPTIDITMTTGRKASNGEFEMVDYRVVTVGMKIYSLYFYYQKNKPFTNIRDKFYQSLLIK